MANVVSGFTDGSLLRTPVFSTQPNMESSQVHLADSSEPRVLIKSNGLYITKNGGELSIGDLTVDITKSTVLDVVNLLNTNDVSAKFLENTRLWNYPALCIPDFSNMELDEVKMTHLPYDIKSTGTFKNKGVVPISPINVSVPFIFGLDFSKRSFTYHSGFIKDIKGYTVFDKAIRRVHVEEFLIKVSDTQFTTTNKEVLCKYLEDSL